MAMDNYTVYLDDVPVPDNERSNLDQAEITIRRKEEDGSTAYGFTSSITFTGRAYEKIYNRIVADVKGINKTFRLKIYDKCCERDVFFGKVTSDGLNWCLDKCEIECDIVEDSIDVQSLQCIQRKFVFDNALGFQQKQHPFVPYCAEMRPNVFQYMWLFLGHGVLVFMYTVVVPLIAVLYPLILVIVAIISLANGDGFPNPDLMTPVIQVIEKLKDYITGCGRGHPSPLVRDYIQNVCDICGLKFRSSILNDPNSQYYNLLYVYAPVNKGFENYATWNEENKPFATGEAYLNEIKQAFNADWRVQNGVLVFERKDYFWNNDTWIQIPQGKEDPRFVSLCFQYSNKQDPAYARLEYQGDGMDSCGDEAKQRYNDLVDWDIPYGEWDRLRGEKTFTIPFAPARFRRDGIEPDVLSTVYDAFSIVFGSAITDGLFGLKEEDNYVMIMAMGKAYVPKLLIWDTTTDYKRAGTIKKPIPSRPSEFYYNIPMWFAAPLDPVATPEIMLAWLATFKPYEAPNLYDQFFYIDDPRLSYLARRGWDFTLELLKSCDEIDAIDFEKSVQLPIVAGVGNGVVTEITIKRSTLIIKGTV